MSRSNHLQAFTRPFILAAMIAIISGLLLIIPAFTQEAESIIGTFGEINSSALTLKTDPGTTQSIRVSASTDYLAVKPGQEDLREARKIEWRDIKPGDRLLVRYSRASDGALEASRVICISTTDLEKARTEQQSDWVRNGTRGVVDRVDIAAREIWLRSRSKPSQSQVRIHVGSNATVRHYSASSLRFDLAEPSSFDQIQEGDQLRAKGTLNAGHTFLEADFVLFGSFQSIVGTLTSVDPSNARLSVRDLKTKHSVMKKSTQFLPKPTDGELEILAVLWDKGVATVRDVCDCLNESRKVGYTSVLKLLQIMFEKGLVKRKEFGRAHLYEPTACREDMQTRLLGELCRQIFSGSAARLAMHALSMTPTSKSDMEEIRRMVTEHRRNR